MILGHLSVFLGYPYGTKGYKLYDLESHKVFISCNVVFFETIFPFQHLSISDTSVVVPTSLPDFSPIVSPSPFNSSHASNSTDSVKSSTPISYPSSTSVSTSATDTATNTDAQLPTRRSTRIRTLPTYLQH